MVMINNNMKTIPKTIWGINLQIVAIFLITLGTILNTLAYLYPNQHKFHPFTTLLVRGICVTLLSYTIGRYQNIDLTFPSSHNFKWLTIRNGIMTFQGTAYAWVQFYLPLPIVVTLMASSPIFTALFDHFLTGALINRKQVVWLSIAFLGVILTANGNYIYYLLQGQQPQADSKFTNYVSMNPITLILAAVFYTLVMCLHGYAIFITKKLINTQAIQINYFLGLIILMPSSVMIFSALGNEDYHMPSVGEWAEAMVLTGLPMALGQLAILYSLLLTHRYGLLAPFQFANILVGYVVSVWRYEQKVNWVCVLGGVAIVLGVVFNVWHKKHSK